MKPLYSPATVQFRVMKEEPEEGFIYPTLISNMWFWNNIKDSWWPNEDNGITAPYRPGEKCYLAEHLHRDRLWVTHADGQPALNVAGIHERWEWMMSRRILPPQSMPLKFARRFFTIVSCMPMQKDGKWMWKIEIKEEK